MNNALSIFKRELKGYFSTPIGYVFVVIFLFLCGLFFPIEQLPVWLRPLSYILPLTYGADALHSSIRHTAVMPLLLDFALLAAFCVVLFAVSLRNIRKKWIV